MFGRGGHEGEFAAAAADAAIGHNEADDSRVEVDHFGNAHAMADDSIDAALAADHIEHKM